MLDSNLKNARILIVDDLEANIDVLAGLLDMEGYTNIKSITDPRDTMSMIRDFDPELILLDLMMPYLSGFDILEQIKQMMRESIGPRKYLPILVLTADITEESKHKALTMGAKDFLSKPFDFIEVSCRIHNLLETQFLYQQLRLKNLKLEDKLVEFLNVMDDWYKQP